MTLVSRRAAAAAAFALTLAIGFSTSRATTYTYELDNSLAADQAGAPALVSDGGTLSASGYSFAAGQGLSLSGVLGPSNTAYFIDIHFSFDHWGNPPGSDGYAKIIDFHNKGQDIGFYSARSAGSNVLDFYGSAAERRGTTKLTDGQSYDIMLTRSAAGLVSAYVNNILQFTYNDASAKNAIFANGIIRFFEDDLKTYPEQSSGRVTYIEVGTTPLPAALPLFASGLGALGLLGWRKRRKSLRA